MAVRAGRTREEAVRRGSGPGPGVGGCRAVLRWAPGGLGSAASLGPPTLHLPERLARDPPWKVLGPEETCVSGRLGRGWGGDGSVRGQGSGRPRGVSSPCQGTCVGGQVPEGGRAVDLRGLRSDRIKSRTCRPLT